MIQNILVDEVFGWEKEKTFLAFHYSLDYLLH